MFRDFSCPRFLAAERSCILRHGVTFVLGCAVGIGFHFAAAHESVEPASLRAEIENLSSASSPDARRAAVQNLKSQYDQTAVALAEILDEDHSDQFLIREFAAEVISHYRAVSAMPTLVKHLSYLSPMMPVDHRSFNIEHYPCAKAIIDMGPSALAPFLFALCGPNNNELSAGVSTDAWHRKYTDLEVELAARVVLALCDNDFERARDMVVKTENLAVSKEVFQRMRYQLEHVLNVPPHLRKKGTVPKA